MHQLTFEMLAEAKKVFEEMFNQRFVIEQEFRKVAFVSETRRYLFTSDFVSDYSNLGSEVFGSQYSVKEKITEAIRGKESEPELTFRTELVHINVDNERVSQIRYLAE